VLDPGERLAATRGRSGAQYAVAYRSRASALRSRRFAPHIARIGSRSAPGLDGRTTRRRGYAMSQRKRKRIEEIFGWMKTVGGLRKSRFVGIATTQLAAHLVGAAYDLLRMARLQQNTG